MNYTHWEKTYSSSTVIFHPQVSLWNYFLQTRINLAERWVRDNTPFHPCNWCSNNKPDFCTLLSKLCIFDPTVHIVDDSIIMQNIYISHINSYGITICGCSLKKWNHNISELFHKINTEYPLWVNEFQRLLSEHHNELSQLYIDQLSILLMKDQASTTQSVILKGAAELFLQQLDQAHPIPEISYNILIQQCRAAGIPIITSRANNLTSYNIQFEKFTIKESYGNHCHRIILTTSNGLYIPMEDFHIRPLSTMQALLKHLDEKKADLDHFFINISRQTLLNTSKDSSIKALITHHMKEYKYTYALSPFHFPDHSILLYIKCNHGRCIYYQFPNDDMDFARTLLARIPTDVSNLNTLGPMNIDNSAYIPSKCWIKPHS